MNPKEVEIALSVSMAEWFAAAYPESDVETTRLEELGVDEMGITLTIDDREFRITVEEA